MCTYIYIYIYREREREREREMYRLCPCLLGSYTTLGEGVKAGRGPGEQREKSTRPNNNDNSKNNNKLIIIKAIINQ